MIVRPVLNVDDVALADRGNGKSFALKYGRVGPTLGPTLGLSAIGCAIHVVAPGKKAFPFHRHHAMDELFYIVSGAGECRRGDRILPVKTGDLVSAPAGTKAHQLINTGKVNLSYLGISSMSSVDIVEYPDSGKFGAAAGIKNGDFKNATYAAMGRVQ